MEKTLNELDQAKLLVMPANEMDKITAFIGAQTVEKAREIAQKVRDVLMEPLAPRLFESMTPSQERALVRLERATYDAFSAADPATYPARA